MNTYGVVGGGGASIHMASSGVVGRQYIWRHRGGRALIHMASSGGGGASIHMAS